MTVEELKKKIEKIGTPEGFKLTIRVSSKSTVQAEVVDDQIQLRQKNTGDIDVIVKHGEEEARMLTIKTADNIPYVKFADLYFTNPYLDTFVAVLQVCQAYMESVDVENPNTD